jgi:hypothetical protein
MSGHDSDQEMERIDNISISSKRSSIAERAPPPPYPRDARDDNSVKAKRSSIAERGPPPPYQRRSFAGQDVEKRDESSSHSKRSSVAERRPPPYPRGPEMDFQPEREHVTSNSPYGLNRSPSINSRTGTPREESMALNRSSTRESLREKKSANLESPSREQRHWQNNPPSQAPTRRTDPPPHSLSVDTYSSPNSTKFDSPVDSEPEVLIDATESIVSAVQISPSSSVSPSHNVIVSPSDNNSDAVKVPSYIRPIDALQESPLRRMNSIPRYNARSRRMDESPLRPRRELSNDKNDTCFAAVLVRQKSLTEDPLPSNESRSSDLASGSSTTFPRTNIVQAKVTSFEQQKPEPTPKSPTLDNAHRGGSTPSRNDDVDDDRSSEHSSSSKRQRQGASSPNSPSLQDDSESEGRSKSRTSSRTSQRGDRKGTTHQWLEYGCV